MRCAFSSIAWKREQAADTATLLHENGIVAVEASPALFSAPPDEVSAEEASAVRAFWQSACLPIVAMQALLFGKPELKLFESQEQREALAAYLRRIFRLAGSLGAGPLIFGSPGNRRRGDLAPDRAFDLAVEFFRPLAEAAAGEGCVLCIEANAEGYGCDFITKHEEALRLVRAVNQAGFGLQIDTGVMQMNGESPADLGRLLKEAGVSPAHVHVSAPFLEPLAGLDASFHSSLRSVLESLGYRGHVSVEMKAPPPAEAAQSLGQAAREVAGLYGGPA